MDIDKFLKDSMSNLADHRFGLAWLKEQQIIQDYRIDARNKEIEVTLYPDDRFREFQSAIEKIRSKDRK